MATLITCPSCSKKFTLEEVMTDDIKKELRAEIIAYRDKKDQEVKQLQEQLSKKDQEINDKISLATKQQEEELRKQILKENDSKLKFLEEKAGNAELEIKELKEKELEGLRLKNELEEMKRDVENEKKKYFF